MSATSRYIDTADVAKLARAELKKAYPYVKFSVHSKRYAGGSSITVGWTDGPTPKQVESVIGRFHGTDFDGMTDSTSYHDSELNGEAVHFGNSYIFTRREISDSLWYSLGCNTLAYWGIEMTPAIDAALANPRDRGSSIRVDHNQTGVSWLTDLIHRFMSRDA